ncbi:MAG: hypothetical protein ACXVIJ_01165 [Thermoanaerobaculia bacterium]
MTPIAIILAASLFAQTSNKPIEPKVYQVHDRRTNGSFSGLTLYVELPGVKNAEVAASRVLLRTATDDAGNDLMPKQKDEPQLDENARQQFEKDANPPTPMTVSIEMKNPPRTAKMVKEVRGDIELYMPSRDPNGTATISKFLSQSGKSLSDRALKANGVDIAIISKAQFDATKAAAGEKRRAEAKAEGKEGEDLESDVKYFLDNYYTPEEGEVLLKVSDPNKHIESITYVDASGAVKRTHMQDEKGMVVLSMYGEKPAADWSLRVNMKTAKNISRYPFALTNIALP